MDKVSDFVRWIFIQGDHKDIAQAQYHQLKSQIPFLYAVLVVNAIAVAYTHFDVAPAYLTVGVLIPMVFLTLLRMIAWLRAGTFQPDRDTAVRKLRQTMFFGAVISAIYIAWSLSLDGYGGPYERGHVALFIAITVIGCIFCLVHVPQAAFLVMVIVTIPYMVYYLSRGQDVYIAMAMNIFLVCLVILKVLLNTYRGFCKLIETQQETERLNAENEHLAQTDSLTSLPNRRYFFSRLNDQISTSAAAHGQFAVGIVDLDRFKPVNDTYGHNVGDHLLTEVGNRLRNLDIPELQVCRLGGDEFGFIYTGDPDQAQAVAQAMCESIRDPFQLGELTISVGGSCGLAIFPDAGETAHVLFDRADYALYTSKEIARGRVTVYSADHEARIRSERAIESALQSADLEKEFEVHFQPIVALPETVVLGFEALARWNCPTLGPIGPEKFIPVAEKTGLIQKMTPVLFRKAAKQIVDLPSGLCLYFNLSAHDITHPETVNALISTMKETGLAAKKVTFELTETSLIASYDAAKAGLTALRAAGAHLALDDFGTGYSSLSYLHRLPIDCVKIDRSFVSGFEDPVAKGVIDSILSLCRSMQIFCVIEGVEDQAQVPLLNKLHCRLAQGYHFSRPQTIDGIVTSLNTTGLISGLPVAETTDRQHLLAAAG